MYDLTAQILQHMHDEGITPKGDINFIFDGKIHRFSTDEDHYGQKSGAYFAFSDGLPNWGFMDYRKHDHMIRGYLDIHSLSWTQRQELQERYQQTRPERHTTAQEQQDEQSRLRAFKEYLRASSDGTDKHPYIRLKHIHNIPRKVKVVTLPQPHDICRQGDLLIPLVNCLSRNFQSLEHISWNTMRTGKHMKGIYKGTHRNNSCFEFPFPDKPEKVIICEGFATGSSVREAAHSRAIVLCAMCRGNIINVARIWRKRTNLPIVIAADNDEPGITAAIDTVKAGYANEYHVPPVKGMDWNDYITSRQ